VLEHVPQCHHIERNQMRIDQQPALLKPGEAGRIDIVSIGGALASASEFDKGPRPDADIDQWPAIMPFDEVKPRLHQRAAEFGACIAIESVEIILVVGREPSLDGVVADTDLWPPGQAAARKLRDQR
jgi:hypothetical protein